MKRWILAGCLVALAACGSEQAVTLPAVTTTEAPVTSSTSTSSTTTTTSTSTSTSTSTTSSTLPPPTTVVPVLAPPPPPPPPPPTAPVRQRVVNEQDWIPLGVASGVTLHYPSHRVERIGFHQSNDEGARAIDAHATVVPFTVMPSRDRLSAPTSSADIVVDPTSEIRSPVTGTVLSVGSYDLYCGLFDFYLNIEPDEHPGWRVRIIHMSGVNVVAGNRVQAGVTVIAPSARQLPFASQVDDLRGADPAWPHVHVEVADPSIPNVANPGSGYENC